MHSLALSLTVVSWRFNLFLFFYSSPLLRPIFPLTPVDNLVVFYQRKNFWMSSNGKRCFEFFRRPYIASMTLEGLPSTEEVALSEFFKIFCSKRTFKYFIPLKELLSDSYRLNPFWGSFIIERVLWVFYPWKFLRSLFLPSTSSSVRSSNISSHWRAFECLLCMEELL